MNSYKDILVNGRAKIWLYHFCILLKIFMTKSRDFS